MRILNKKKTVLVISDTQVPFIHPDTLKFLKAIKTRYSPTDVVHIGDVVDFHTMSDHETDPDGYSSGHELKHAIRSLRGIYKLFPKCTVTLGNHDRRLWRRAMKAGIPLECIRDLGEILRSPEGWDWVDYTIIDGVVYEHGDSFGGLNAAVNHVKNNLRSTVIGHHHSNACIRYLANREELTFAMSVGCLMDTKSYAAAYGKKFAKKSIISVGIVDRGLPIIVPMLLDVNGRWIGKLP